MVGAAAVVVMACAAVAAAAATGDGNGVTVVLRIIRVERNGGDGPSLDDDDTTLAGAIGEVVLGRVVIVSVSYTHLTLPTILLV